MTQAARQLTRLTVLCLSLHSFNVAPAPTFESTWLIEELAKADAPLIYLVGLNLAMLDMLGNDVHMAAALIGHELAHLKLNHGRERSEKGGGATLRRTDLVATMRGRPITSVPSGPMKPVMTSLVR